jgi:hypothetical protein
MPRLWHVAIRTLRPLHILQAYRLLTSIYEVKLLNDFRALSQV